MINLSTIVSLSLMRYLIFGKRCTGRIVVYLSAFLLLQSSFVRSQEDKADSLQKLLETTLPDSTRIEVLLALTKEHENNEIAANLFEEALKMSATLEDQKWLFQVIKRYAQYMRDNGKPSDAIVQTYEQGLKLLSDPAYLILVHYMLGEFYFGQGEDAAAQKSINKGIDLATTNDLPIKVASGFVVSGNGQFYKLEYEKAFTLYSKADSVCAANQELSTSSIRAKTLNYMGYSVRVTHGYDKAIEYYFKAKDMYEELNDSSGVQEVNLGLSQYYTKIGDYEKAEHLLTQAIAYYREHGPISSYTYAIISRGYCFLKQKQFDAARKDYQLYYDIAFESTNKLLQLNALSYMSYLYYEMNSLDLAARFGEEGIKLSQEIGEKENRKKLYEQLVVIYTNKKATGKLNQTYKDYIALRDELDSIGKDKEIFELEAKYQSEKKEKQIDLLTAQNQLAQSQKRIQLYVLLGIVLMILILAILFYVLYRNRQKVARKLQELDTAKSNFFANISHEFRTPLTLIKGPLQKELSQEHIEENRLNNLQMINRNTDRLLELVDQLLDLSRLESGSLQLKVEKTSLSSFSNLITAPFKYLAEQKAILFTTDIAEMDNCYFDKDVLEKIVSNLLSNAVKYTPEGGTIQYQQTVRSGWAVITVKNTGEGIPEDQQHKIFDRFYQMSDAKEGAGIGLALVKELVTLHKGSIGLKNDESEYTCFEVKFPIAEAAYSKAEFVSVNKPVGEKLMSEQVLPDAKGVDDIITTEKPIMLIVDDSADLRKLIKDLFSPGYTILLAENGEDGINKALEHVPDIIVSDVMMPVKDGVFLSKTLKADERTSHVPIILLTAKAGDENELKGLETGADEYMVKPFNSEILKIRVEKLIELRAQLRARYSQEVVLRPKEVAITSVDEKFLDRIQLIIDNHLTKPDFTAELFSKEIGMSRMQLHRKLKALIGLSTSEFIRSQRLKMAIQILNTSDVNISEVGYAVGFNDPSYFGKCFRETYGCTPSQYIAEAQKR